MAKKRPFLGVKIEKIEILTFLQFFYTFFYIEKKHLYRKKVLKIL